MPETKPEIRSEVRQELALARLDPQALISQAIEKGAGIDTLERLVALAKDVREVQAREAWYTAMAEFQRRCPPILKTATAKIATRTGPGFEYHYAPLDEIMSTILPVMGPLGLSVSWRSRVEPLQVIVTCRVSHTLGHHEESGEIAMPIVQGDGGATPPQRVGIAATYAKRYALLGIIGMAPEDDDDAQSSEGPLPSETPAENFVPRQKGAPTEPPTPADHPSVSVEPVRFVINGTPWETKGITQAQVLETFRLEQALKKLKLGGLVKEIAMKEFQVTHRRDLTKDQAEKFIVRLKEVAGE